MKDSGHSARKYREGYCEWKEPQVNPRNEKEPMRLGVRCRWEWGEVAHDNTPAADSEEPLSPQRMVISTRELR